MRLSNESKKNMESRSISKMMDNVQSLQRPKKLDKQRLNLLKESSRILKSVIFMKEKL